MFYRVRVITSAHDPKNPTRQYAKTYYDGLFITNQVKTTNNRIEKEVTEYIGRKLKDSNPHLEFTFKISKCEKLGEDFIVTDSHD